MECKGLLNGVKVTIVPSAITSFFSFLRPMGLGSDVQ